VDDEKASTDMVDCVSRVYPLADTLSLMTLGQRVREKRKAAGLTQTALAERAGISQSTIVRTERDETVPDGATLVVLARELQTSVPWLLSGDESAAVYSVRDGADEQHVERGQVSAVPAAVQFAGEPGEMPETLGQRKNYDRQEQLARRTLAKEGETIEEWVWPHVRATNNFALEDSPPGVRMLCELAKFIRDFGNPDARPRKK
jgi:transcriptional regulator with XRE-family HTH domain